MTEATVGKRLRRQDLRPATHADSWWALTSVATGAPSRRGESALTIAEWVSSTAHHAHRQQCENSQSHTRGCGPKIRGKVRQQYPKLALIGAPVATGHVLTPLKAAARLWPSRSRSSAKEDSSASPFKANRQSADASAGSRIATGAIDSVRPLRASNSDDIHEFVMAGEVIAVTGVEVEAVGVSRGGNQ